MQMHPNSYHVLNRLQECDLNVDPIEGIPAPLIHQLLLSFPGFFELHQKLDPTLSMVGSKLKGLTRVQW